MLKTSTEEFKEFLDYYTPKVSKWAWKTWLAQKAVSCLIPNHLSSAAYLSCLKDTDKLDECIFGKYLDEQEFCGIVENKPDSDSKEFSKYETLGDLQGTSLLKTKETLQKTVQIMFDKAREQNIRYLEIRCSPINYICKEDKFFEKDVVKTILDEMKAEEQKPNGIKSSLIFIASRHSDLDKIQKAIELYKKFLTDKELKGLFETYFRGFDLAGDEQQKSPKDVHENFLEILKACLNITIHAGEIAPAENIWEAVYYLNAERIGHGLTLKYADENLQNKFLTRRIGIEMCPSSNYQIVGFKDNYYPEKTTKDSGEELEKYPLKEYLDKHFRVCVNTDNPGISRTNMTNELHKAARMTAGGLSLWDILQLIYNSFDLAFYPYQKKKELRQNVNKEIRDWLKENKDEILRMAGEMS